jgi:hypothetical protein
MHLECSCLTPLKIIFRLDKAHKKKSLSLLQWLVVLSLVLAPPAPLLLLLIVLSLVLARLAPLLLLLVLRCRLVALVLAFVLVPPAPLLLLLIVWCWLVSLVLAFVLAPPAPLLQCVFALCQMIDPNSSIQDWHALLLDKEPWFDSSIISSLPAAHGADS